MGQNADRIAALACAFLLMTGCTYNPFVADNQTTGSVEGAVIGAGAGAGLAAYGSASKPWLWVAGIAGGAAGYYVTTLRYESGGIIQDGGTVYKIGDLIGIYIPTDNLFEPNTAILLPKATAVLESAATILRRTPDNNIIISGNTSGFYRARWEQHISEQRAQKVAAYLWNAGINNFTSEQMEKMRKLAYVGYGDFFPIANHYENTGIRANSRVQIISYPDSCDLGIDKRHMSFLNVGKDMDEDVLKAPSSHCKWGKDGSATDCWED